MAAASSGREAQLYWLALHLVPGLGARNVLKLIRAFGNPGAFFHASLSELRSCGIRRAVAAAIHSGLSFEDGTAKVEKAANAGAEIVSFQDPRYPPQLKKFMIHRSCSMRAAVSSFSRPIQSRLSARGGRHRTDAASQRNSVASSR